MHASAKKSMVRMGAFGGGAALVLGGMAAYAAIPSTDGTIYGCYGNSNGATRIIDPGKQKCTSSEKPISWSQRGPRGLQGVQGKTGATGKAGKNGKDGKDGVNAAGGLSGYEIVEKGWPDQQLPIDGNYLVNCPDGKVALAGGTIIQLYKPGAFVDLGDPARYGYPEYDNGHGSWVSFVSQESVDGATEADISSFVACADGAPIPDPVP